MSQETMSEMLAANSTISHYRIAKKIGAGGMGEVYLAEDTKLDRQVALKILPPEFAEDKDRMSRFVREAKSASALNHPNIITIYDIGETDGTQFIAAEYIAGETLHARLRQNLPDLKTALEIAIQVASALDAAHRAGIIHRDIKPENVMLRPDGLVKLLDFGIAKLSEKRAVPLDEEAATAIKPEGTSPGMIIGTANYMSPEQAKGKEIDARSDIFSFGIVLYEMLAGKRAFVGENALDVLGAILHKEPVPLNQILPELPREIERIVSKTLRKEREERYQTIKDVMLDLRELRDDLAMEARLERSIRPATSRIENQQPVIAEGETTENQIAQATNGASTSTRSSAEYLAGEIKRHKRGIVVASFIVLAAVIGLGFWFSSLRSATAKQIESIAVMPFVNESGNQEVEYLSDGMTETMIRSLSQLPGLNVKARSTVFRYKGKDADAKTVGKELGVQAILNGRVVQRGEQLILSLELISAQTENVIWSEQYNRRQADLVTLQSEIARDVSSKLRIKLSGADQQNLAKNYTNDPEAYRLYLQGRFYWNKLAGRDYEKAEGYFRQAIEKDPNFALGYVGLADFYNTRDRDKAKENVRRALALDDGLAEAHVTLGYQYMLDYDWAACEREMKRALDLDPKNLELHRWNGQRLMMLGRYDEAFASYRRALELDPTSSPLHFTYGACLIASGQLDKGIEYLENAAKADPSFAWIHSHLAFAYRIKGIYARMAEERALAQELVGKPDKAKLIRNSFAAGGRDGCLREMIRQALEDKPEGLNVGMRDAPAYALLGENEKAIASLEYAAEKGEFWLFSIKYDTAYDQLRGDPRFQVLLKKFDPPQ